MNKFFILCAIGVASCTNPTGTSNKETDTSATISMPEETSSTSLEDRTYCFIRTEGSSNQDTTTVYFAVTGNRVDGHMNWIPKEKDSRKGTLKGSLSGAEITAVWRYMQEGMVDSVVVAFKLSPQQLSQKPMKFNISNDKQETDQGANYVLHYLPYDCEHLAFSKTTDDH